MSGDPRYAPEAAPEVEEVAMEFAGFSPVEIDDRPLNEDREAVLDVTSDPGTIEIDVAGGPQLRIVGACDPEALARLIRGLSP